MQFQTQSRRFLRAAAAIGALALTVSLAGCAPEPIAGGTSAPTNTPTATTSQSASPTPDSTPTPTESTTEPGNASSNGSSDSTSEQPASDPGGATNTDPAPSAGTIALSWTGGAHQNYTYEATECMISDSYVSVEGTGTSLDGTDTSTIHIFTSPQELIHEGTGTYQAAGIIRVTTGEGEMVADDRMQDLGAPNPIPSTLQYRMQGAGIKYVVDWWMGSGDVGAGAVEVVCHY